MSVLIKTSKREKHVFCEMAYSDFMNEVEDNDDEKFIAAVTI